MKIFLLVGVIVSSFGLFIDTILLSLSFFSGEKLHPQLMDHWPMNVVLVIGFVYFFEQQSKSKPTQP